MNDPIRELPYEVLAQAWETLKPIVLAARGVNRELFLNRIAERFGVSRAALLAELGQVDEPAPSTGPDYIDELTQGVSSPEEKLVLLSRVKADLEERLALMQNELPVAAHAMPATPMPARPVTTTLPPFGYDVPRSLDEIFGEGPSSVGYHSTSDFLECPERARLKALHVRRKPKVGESPHLNALQLGAVIHALLATRVAYGQAMAEAALVSRYSLPPDVAPPLDLWEEDRIKILNIMRMYDYTFPLDREPFQYIGIETPIFTDVGEPGRPCIKSAKYDKLIRAADAQGYPVVFSLEHKTAARGGAAAMNVYLPQASVQAAIWNCNKALVEQYGYMPGIIFDVIVKSTVPQCERHAPRYISRLEMQRAIEYLRLSDQIQFPVNADGTHYRAIHACWGKFQPCPYIGICWGGSYGEYEQACE